MRFLVTMRPKHMMPPEVALGIMDAMLVWGKKHQASGKIEQMWAFAGIQGGGGIVSVDSLEELNQVQAECPMAPFAETEILPIIDFKKAISKGKGVLTAMKKKK